MTVAVGVFQGTPQPGVWLAADTLAMRGDTKHHVSKIVRFEGGAFALSGHMLGKDMGGKVVESCLANGGLLSMAEFVLKTRAAYEDLSWSPIVSDGTPAWWDQTFLLTDGSSIVTVQCDLNWIDYKEYAVTGCGGEVALGSLHTSGGQGYTARQRADMAVGAACEHSRGCGGKPEVVFMPRGKRVIVP